MINKKAKKKMKFWLIKIRGSDAGCQLWNGKAKFNQLM